jgi:hypothetical protein
MDKQAIDGLYRVTVREANHFAERNKSAPHELLLSDWVDLLKRVKEMGRSSDLATIVVAEKLLVKNDLDRYANSTDMKTSLTGALEDFDRIERHMTWVADPAQYRRVNEAYDKDKNRVNGVPKDEARQAFSSHITRLGNLHKSRLVDEEKAILDARRSNMATGAKLYEQMQAKAIGLTPKQPKKSPLSNLDPEHLDPETIAFGEIMRIKGMGEAQVTALMDKMQAFKDEAKSQGIELPSLVKVIDQAVPVTPVAAPKKGLAPQPSPRPKR